MLAAMRIRALDYLFQKLGANTLPDDTDEWYRQLKENSPKEIFPFLVESPGQIEHVYIIEKNTDHALLTVRDMQSKLEKVLPFVKPVGSQAAQVGPVIKRSYDKKKGTGGPSAKILNTTMKYFQEIAEGKQKWAAYFREVLSVLDAEEIRLTDGSLCNWKASGYDSMLECVVDKIGPSNKPTFLTVKTEDGEFPGQSDAYRNYLMTEILATNRYLTKKIRAVSDAECSLCGAKETTVFPNALKGAGINLTNVDRSGRFSGMSIDNAWKNFPLCAGCADLLYIYKNHVLRKRGPKKDIRPYTALVAGESALVIPYCTTDAKIRFEVWNNVRDYVRDAGTDVGDPEEELLDLLSDQKGLLNLTFLWCKIGQSLEDVTGSLTDVPPSRLRFLSDFNEKTREWRHPLFPYRILNSPKIRVSVNLALSAFKWLFWRPGGKKAPNATRRLSELRRLLASAVYYDRTLREEHQRRLWDEILVTAQWWWLEAINQGDAYGLLNEGIGKKGKPDYLTAAGWIRHWAWWLYYFKKLGVLEMEKGFYEPDWDELKPYFGPESGINSPQKAYSFLLGVLYGKLLEIQGARGVNVGANALTWLKRLRLRGEDLPELYIKVREKLLAYESEKSQKVRQLIGEIGTLGIRLGDPIELSQTQTNYYLLLGQSMTKKILKKEEK